MIFLSFLQNFLPRYARSIRYYKFEIWARNLNSLTTVKFSYILFFFVPEASLQSAPDHAENRIKLDINAPKSCCRTPYRIRELYYKS